MIITTPAGAVSQPFVVDRGSIVTITPTPGATALVEYTTANATAIANGVAVWSVWSKGTVFGATSDLLAVSVFMRITARKGAASADVDANPSNASLSQYLRNWAPSANALAAGDTNLPVPVTNPRVRMVFIGDSLTYGGAPGRAPGIFDGRPWYGSTTVTTLANLGGGSWLVYCMVDGRAGTAGGTLETDAANRIRWTYTGDPVPGPWVDVSQGGWKYLDSGSLANSGILVAIRGATTAPVNASSGVTTAGLATISDYNWLGYVPWVAGAMGDTFADYQAFGITGATTADILKYAPQALLTDVEVVCLLLGVNDAPGDAAAAAASIVNIKAVIDLARAKARRVYVSEIAPNPSATVVVNQFLARVSDAIRAYCRTLKNVRFVSAFDKMVSANAIALGGAVPLSNPGGRTGMYNPADNLHFMPLGAYTFAKPVIAALLQDYPKEQVRNNTVATWDSTLQVGTISLNPALRGSAGTVTAANGITGTAPDSFTLSRSGSTQTCTTTFETAADGGLDWWAMDVAGSTAGDYHELVQQFNVPAGYAVGDYFQIVLEAQIFSATGAGLAILQAQSTSGGNVQSAYLIQAGRDLSGFGSDTQPLFLRSEPQKVLPGYTLYTMRIRIGARTGGGAGKVGFRRFSFEKCAGPIYP